MASSSNPATPQSIYTVTITPTIGTSSSSSNLSASARTGVALGTILGFALLLTIVGGILLYRRRNAQKESKAKPGAPSEEKAEDPSFAPEGPQGRHGGASNPSELHSFSQPPGLELVGSEIHQLPVPPPELGSSEIHELAAGN